MKLPSNQEFRLMRAMYGARSDATAQDMARAAKLEHRGVYVLLARLRDKGYAGKRGDAWQLTAAGRNVVKAFK